MVPFLYTAREHHAVTSPAAYRARHAATMTEKGHQGHRARVHRSPHPARARVDAGSWIIDCECGAGNATDPAWGIACCFGCGAVHEAVEFPPEAAAIEALLVARPKPIDRAWRPGETTAALTAENQQLGRVTP